MRIFTWRDEPILDIEQWTHNRGEKIAIVTFRKREVNPFAKNPKNMIIYSEETEEMPEVFYHGLSMLDNYVAIKVKYRDPRIQEQTVK